jgi:hypothetical protein
MSTFFHWMLSVPATLGTLETACRLSIGGRAKWYGAPEQRGLSAPLCSMESGLKCHVSITISF